jgi:hypothetical protein
MGGKMGGSNYKLTFIGMLKYDAFFLCGDL